ncbi:MAG: ParB N-terminal domain-containing protein [Nitrosopumilus sp.]|uniref:ParB N-terminal domain-containing protein n=1 Tax=Nitrosopumilus sp. TaxID=2024843 RepID=UPI0024308757|nr:ParB N-terminal domain-containing protein [Nitrosopumilus sp.]MCV0366403.1 ParB N-terminal domain-containing protein [Nitrosopumilus sp.]
MNYLIRLVPVEKIIVENRIRQDLGDIDGLSSSIKHVGLLQPIGINKDNVLVFGQRRLEAVKKLGWKEIQSVILEDNDE